jgi:hypothetical protein
LVNRVRSFRCLVPAALRVASRSASGRITTPLPSVVRTKIGAVFFASARVAAARES